jgi:hypothetical protein
MKNYFDLAGQVLDHELLDADDYPCGQVDDIEIDVAPGRPPTAKALLVGPGAWIPRLPGFVQPVAEKLFGREVVEVPWDEIREIAAKVKLRAPAIELGLGKADRKAESWMAKLLRS